MTRFRLTARPIKQEGAQTAGATQQARAHHVFRRFFDLIERFERPRGADPAPEIKARITRLDDKPHR